MKKKKYYCTGLNRLAGQGNSNACCKTHDHAYGKYGTGTRKQADIALRECMKKAGHPILAWIAYGVVRVFGGLFYVKEKAQKLP